MLTRAARNVLKTCPPRRGMAYVAEFKPPTLNDLPVPQGSWRDTYNQRQRKYNLQLVGGLLFTGGTLAFAKESGLIFFGYGPEISSKE
ncbi:hypothetical protein Pmani_031372 [Petrolisthes manimaculis]|uniref:Deltamethrin resistance protein prag01 domain-containing protein n=1 Tax=Petrolisthes manimaculis TaxID=1843537 RepID=A0AAE1NW22_9EUCA|nr:hypothetical protein Pmani_031372 [Petrolisthes manimaculis]